MEPENADKSVPRQIEALFSNQRVVLRETSRAVTPFGGVAVFVAFLKKLGFIDKVRQHMPFRFTSPNHIEPTETLVAFLVSVLAGARRFAQTGLLRGDRALHALLGVTRFPTDDTICNLFRRFSMGDVHRLFDPLAEWMMERLPLRQDGYTLDLDSTVFERYGSQEGSLKGHNPRKHGRPSHHPLLAVLAEAHFLLHGWLRSGNCASARGSVEFLKEALALWSQRQKIRLVRADSGFFDDKLLSFLEQCCLPYIVVARMTRFIQREAQRVANWRALDENYSVGQFYLKLCGWQQTRRFVVVRELVRESHASKRAQADRRSRLHVSRFRHYARRRQTTDLARLQPRLRRGMTLHISCRSHSCSWHGTLLPSTSGSFFLSAEVWRSDGRRNWD